MSNLIFNELGITERQNVPVVSSRALAEKFGKRHDSVLRALKIKNVVMVLENAILWFLTVVKVKVNIKNT